MILFFLTLGLYVCVNHFFVHVSVRTFARYVCLLSTTCARQQFHTTWLWYFFSFWSPLAFWKKRVVVFIDFVPSAPCNNKWQSQSLCKGELYAHWLFSFSLHFFKYLTVFSCNLAFLTFVLSLLRSWKVLLHRATCLLFTVLFVVVKKQKKH